MNKQKGISAIKGAVSTAHWEGLTKEEAQAVFLAAILETYK